MGLLFCGLSSVWSAFQPAELHSHGMITGHVQHHEQPIPSAMVYIKYGVTEFPGVDPSAYDDSTIANPSNGQYLFENLSRGSYYIYAKGFDRTVIDSVAGGVSIEISKHDEIVEINVPVTE